ncbi:hypothetical protein D3C83_118520 [compost metagenome]
MRLVNGLLRPVLRNSLMVTAVLSMQACRCNDSLAWMEGASQVSRLPGWRWNR